MQKTSERQAMQVEQKHHVQKSYAAGTVKMPPAEDIIGASFGFLVEALKFPGQEAFKAAQDVTGVAKSIFTFGFALQALRCITFVTCCFGVQSSWSSLKAGGEPNRSWKRSCIRFFAPASDGAEHDASTEHGAAPEHSAGH